MAWESEKVKKRCLKMKQAQYEAVLAAGWL